MVEWVRLELDVDEWLATFHHPRNASAIAMNRRLGFVDQISGERVV